MHESLVAYLDGVIVFDCSPSDHVANIRFLRERLRRYNLNLSPTTAQVRATQADFLGPIIFSDGSRDRRAP